MRTNQKLGQHFLEDPAAARKIVDAAGITPSDLVVEIGSGKGALTHLLVQQAEKVVGIELDRRLCEDLQKRFAGIANFYVVNQDALETDLEQLIRGEGFEQAILVGNLPYQITGALVEKILSVGAFLKWAVVMVQREVGRRMVASPGGKEYGILSVAVQIRALAERLFDLGPGHFHPPPQVHSSVIRLDFPSRQPVPIQNERFFFKLVRAAFQQRRKMLKNTLSKQVPVPESGLLAAMNEAGVDPQSRPETVSGEQFEKICGMLLTQMDRPLLRG
ncbi:MAG: 16S rRNA (adenine(1518)-N(6)/adenine(1519)-N(6))-dimethyltransferase RsmA [bacterium]|nr:16S rRNA (adenine(1518)-N(6)/adenine(1519)-N(6))-dimethyltransferase RsmA [bacterium]